jgi:predicted ATPase/class 3 adenylate cyclase
MMGLMGTTDCGACGTPNEPGRKFCGECGAPLARSCGSCGSGNAPDAKFCGECGTSLVDAPAPESRAAPQAERRLVTVLFVDLVGFTTASEGRDAEETRELLTRYFDAARTTVERYGGTIEKFIGDAVMALWGAPVAHEDDAERAVRAALDLVAAVPALDAALQARAGVLTGEAAVTLGAEGQGMVAGDLVNTASRIQSAAEPGAVLVGDATRAATEAAIAYAEPLAYRLKGKAGPVPLSRALRVVAGRGGEGRATRLEAPLAGRERELRMVKELFHAAADDGRAHLLSIVGVAGIGKSRLAWEFEKYVDGLADDVWWHRGRCLSYGDGVAYWALAEMVRMRARITEDEPAEQAQAKLDAVLVEIVADPEERSFVAPRLQHLLGLTERTALDREDLFSAWRLFLERMAEQHPVVMVFEDLQWADAALVEFLEYLLHWSRTHPLFVVTLSRPDVAERHPAWGANVRGFTSLALEPLEDEAIEALLRGLIPGLPAEGAARILDRADGIPLYAVETVRMLLDRGLLEPGENGYRAKEELVELDVPESLHALIAARLDGLADTERRVLQDAAVLGKSFAARGVAALAGVGAETVKPVLDSLARKEVLSLDSDARSPERGQYRFVQAMVQHVAYEQLSRRDRKARHLAAADYLIEGSGLEPDEIAEVLAAHFLDAYRAVPADPDSDELRRHALRWLVRGGERAAALAATDDALRAFEAAAELTDDPTEHAHLLERAGDLARAADRLDLAERHLRAAYALSEEAGATQHRARVAAALGRAFWNQGRIEEALELQEEAFALLSSDEPDAGTAELAAELGRVHTLAGNREIAAARIETALDIAEELRLPAVVAAALNTKALIVSGHTYEADALMRQALRIALENELVFEALRAYNNLIVLLEGSDRNEEMGPLLEEALALARRRGDRFWETRLSSGLVEDHLRAGRWDEALAVDDGLPLDPGTVDAPLLTARLARARIALDRGDRPAAQRTLTVLFDDVDHVDLQLRMCALRRRLLAAELEGRLEEAASHAVRELQVGSELDSAGIMADALRELSTYTAAGAGVAFAREALAVGAALRANAHTRMLDCQLYRLEAIVAAAEGRDADAADAFGVALAAARNLGYAYFLAPVLADYGAWLAAGGRPDEAAPLVQEARELFEAMGAGTWLERLERAAGSAVAV